MRLAEEEHVGQQQEHAPEGVDRIEEPHREQSAGEIEPRSKVLSHAYDEGALACLAVLGDVSVVVHDEDVDAAETYGGSQLPERLVEYIAA